MIVLAALLWVQDSPPPALAQDDIVIFGERMRRVRVVIRTDRTTGAARCVVKRRSGDDMLDTLMCRATLTCARTVTKVPEMKACLSPTIAGYAKSLADRRAAAAKGVAAP